MKHRPVIAFGDSMTQGHLAPIETVWPHLLGVALSRHLGADAPRVLNAGRNGNTSVEGLARIENDVLAHRPGLVLVEFGNDATDDPARHVPVDRFLENLRTIHRLVTGIGGRTMLMTFPPIVSAWHSNRDNPNYAKTGGPDGTQEQYRKATRGETKKLACPFFDLDGCVRTAAQTLGWEALIQKSDGVHFTDAGNRLVAETLTPIVLGLLAVEKREPTPRC
jgi:lysophospholipase L1-like esterase